MVYHKRKKPQYFSKTNVEFQKTKEVKEKKQKFD